MVLLEAMRHKKAAVIANVPGSGMSWVVEDGATGLHVPPADADALANCLSILQQDRDRLAGLGRVAQERFNQYFRMDRSAARVHGLYRQMVECNAKKRQ